MPGGAVDVQWTWWKWAKGEAQCNVCVLRWVIRRGGSLKAEPWQLRRKHVQGMFVLHLPRERSCVHCPFPRTTEHNRRPRSSSSVQPLSQSTGGPRVHICTETLSVSRYVLCSSVSACVLDLDQSVKLDAIWTTSGWSALLTGYNPYFHYLARRTANVVPFRELAMVALPGGVLLRYQVCFS